jgi:hypothetical protein
MSYQTVTNSNIVAPAEVHEQAVVVEQEIRVYSHSTIFYWWPAWFFGLLIGFVNLSEGAILSANHLEQTNSALGLIYVSILLLLIIFTNVKLRGIKSIVVLLAIAFITVLLAWFGWWDQIVRLIPYLSVHMDTGFYLVFSTALLVIWLSMFFVFDRMTFWRIRPGQLTVEHSIGGAAESFDTNALRFQKLSSDLFRVVLGLGTGDLQATGTPNGTTLYMPNVTFAGRKVQAIERLIAVKPDFAS